MVKCKISVFLAVLAIAWTSQSARTKQPLIPTSLRKLLAQEIRNDIDRSPYCLSFFCRFPNRCCPGYVCRFNAFQPYFKGICVRQVNFDDVLGLGADYDKIDSNLTPLASTNATGNTTTSTTARPSNATAVSTTTVATTTTSPNCTTTETTTSTTAKYPLNATVVNSSLPYVTNSTIGPRINDPTTTSFLREDLPAKDVIGPAAPVLIIKTLNLTGETPLNTPMSASPSRQVPVDTTSSSVLANDNVTNA